MPQWDNAISHIWLQNLQWDHTPMPVISLIMPVRLLERQQTTITVWSNSKVNGICYIIRWKPLTATETLTVTATMQDTAVCKSTAFRSMKTAVSVRSIRIWRVSLRSSLLIHMNWQRVRYILTVPVQSQVICVKIKPMSKILTLNRLQMSATNIAGVKSLLPTLAMDRIRWH